MNNNFRCSYRKQKGFSIVEVVIATSILTFCAVALFASLHLSFNIVNDIRENITASSIIQEEMEKLRKTFFVELPPLGESAFSNSSFSSLYNSSGAIKVEQYTDSNILKVSIRVRWYSRLKTSKQHTKCMVTLITKNGINSI